MANALKKHHEYPKRKKVDHNKCGHCASYSMWTGTCLHPQSPIFESGEDYIYERKPCDLFTLDPDYE